MVRRLAGVAMATVVINERSEGMPNTIWTSIGCAFDRLPL